jgi:hypothetical protein
VMTQPDGRYQLLKRECDRLRRGGRAEAGIHDEVATLPCRYLVRAWLAATWFQPGCGLHDAAGRRRSG